MIDLDAYLDRIRYAGPREPTLDVLNAICALHPASIAYENIDPLLGNAPVLTLPALQEKLIAQHRGGYCFEQNLLLKEALQALGMRVTALAARVVWMQPPNAPPRARNHMLLKVELADGEAGSFVADAGFGGNLMSVPLMLKPEVIQHSAHATLRFSLDQGVYTLETQLPTGWAPMYRFTLEPHQPVDYEPLNWFTATHPGSIFRHNLMLERLTPDLRMGLFNDRLILRRPGHAPQMQRIATQAEFAQLIVGQFGLQVPQPVLAQLFERIPKGLDQFTVPTA